MRAAEFYRHRHRESNTKLDLGQYYTDLYKGRSPHDSPERSRTSIAKKIADLLKFLPNQRSINLGSGPQILERQIYQHIHSRGKNGTEILKLMKGMQHFTLDKARLEPYQLKAKDHAHITHLCGDALNLPFPKDTFGLAMSNHAIDFIPRSEFDRPYQEILRILAPCGFAVLYFHHPDMIPQNLNQVKKPEVREHWQYLRDNQILFEDEQRIYQVLANVGFVNISVMLNTTEFQPWWEVSAQKPDHSSEI